MFRGVQSTTAQSVVHFWTTGVRQLTALAIREHREAAIVIQGARLYDSLDLFTLEAGGVLPPQEECHEPPPRPALYSWLN